MTTIPAPRSASTPRRSISEHVTSPSTRAPLGLRIAQLAVPALAIPSAIGIADFLSDGQTHYSPGGIIAAIGFELLNISLSILDITQPELQKTAAQVRFWSVATAITFNVLAHYQQRVPEYSHFDALALILAVVASVPIAVLYVSMAGLLHRLGAHDAAQDEAAAQMGRALHAAQYEAQQARAAAHAAQQEHDRSMRDLRDQLDTLRGQRDHLHNAAAQHTSDLAQRTSDLAQLRSAATQQYSAQEVTIAQLRSQVEHMRKENDRMRATMRENETPLRERDAQIAHPCSSEPRPLDTPRTSAQPITDDNARSRALQLRGTMSNRRIAEEIGRSESTVRGWFRAADTSAITQTINDKAEG